jgi:uncharacterized protein YcbK (DUF882 family)
MEDIFKRWGNFTKEELLSPGGLLLLSKGVLPLRVESVDKLQAFRETVNRPLFVNMPFHHYRGFRTPEENRRIYQKFRIVSDKDKDFDSSDNRFSYHLQGCAFDITCPEMEIGELYLAAKEFGWRGIGIYKTFIHVDDRPGVYTEWRQK